jgi:hypothetical protein
MRDQLADLKNLFAEEDITDPKIDLFAVSVVNKITIINTTGPFAGMFTAPLAVLTVAQNPFHTAMLELPTDLTLGTGSVEVAGTVMSDFKKFASNFKGMITDLYFKDHHEIYITFYPHELTDINAINKTTALPLMNRLATAFHTNVADLTPELDARAASFVTRQVASTLGRDVATGSIGDDRSTRNTGRPKLNDALFEMYNFCKYKYKCDYTKMHNIFPLETLLRHPRHEINHYNGSVEALSTANIAQEIYEATKTALFRNLSDCDMLVGLGLTATTAVTAEKGELVKAKRSKSFVIASTGSPEDHFLNVTNLNLKDAGIWEMDVFEES